MGLDNNKRIMSGTGPVIQELRKFVAPEFVFGVGARFQAARYARNLGASRVLVVSDPGVIAAGWTQSVIESLQEEGLNVVLFSNVTPNPRDHEIMAGAARYSEAGCDAIVVVGGGSPIDCAKGISIIAANGRHILDFEGVDTIPKPGPPLICIPTTAGTAADVSQFAIVTDVARRNKIAIISKAVVPDVSLIDPETTSTVDPYLAACTGVDALTHAVEAMVSNAHSPITDLHAVKAIELVRMHLGPLIADPHDTTAREGMMLGCLEAGLAFSNASLGATHAMAHSLGGLLDVPHGECNAILLNHVMAFNFPNALEQYEAVGRALGLDLKGMTRDQMRKRIVNTVSDFRDSVGVHRDLRTIGVRSSDVVELAEKALLDPCLVTNPRPANRRDLEVLYEEAL